MSCLEAVPGISGDATKRQQAGPNLAGLDTLPLPQWCIDNAFTGVWALRTDACEVLTLHYWTYTVTDGVETLTGELSSVVSSYAYTSTTLTTFAHQVDASPASGWGDALRATISGNTTAAGACVVDSSTFDTGPVQPFNSLRAGEAFFTTTATAPGAVGSCTTTWNLVYTNAGYPPATAGVPMTPIRCDNATAGNNSAGCVIPWYASALIYSSSLYPDLASHVSRAQRLGGLPGNSFARPLTRTTNQNIIDTNRNRACGDAPSIADKSCDEYPIARSRQGLSSGGTRRTFDNCDFNLPRSTDPAGVSVCMINATENNAQGGLNTQFFRRERVLDGDPFRVLVGA
ncbi:NucA/NucB deoxyribonuclease domain-containing protein [Mangrovihabitans endophyticus]|uniref:Deoxyribonuclease NucA/NucB domain-containing protein n=1 Tax=Mangrovihabitans endophyticus TaxID=1751298 RepID=A0A8J3BTJ9_9ACTN|nr:hypothetical protein [Mangrovihabitans endophyticus]GGK73350.1 hypothetical protein GCM10012284_04020 [Mangrovihabitans endophyticus]